MRGRALIVACVVVFGAARVAADDAAPKSLDLSDFAYAIPLQLQSAAGIQTLVVPPGVYRGSIKDGLADVRVFNGLGQVVPHAIRTLSERPRIEHGARRVPVFPLFATKQDAAPQAASLHVVRSAEGAVLDIRSSLTALPTDSKRVTAYVFDTHGCEQDMNALRLELENNGATYVLPVSVDASDDLSSWHQVAGQVVVARLDYEDKSIERAHIQLASTRAPFLRLTWAAHSFPVRVLGAHVEFGASEGQVERARMRVIGKQLKERGVYEFDLGGPVPVDRLNVGLPTTNVLVQAALSSTATRTAAFEPAFEGQFYRVQREGTELTTPASDIMRRRHRYWRLRVDDKGGGLGDAPPTLEVEYAQEQLLFMARGAGPFQLAYGSHAARASTFDAQQLLGIVLVDEREEPPHQTVSLGAQKRLAGRSALMPPPPPSPFKVYALWSVLILGASALLVLALRLMSKVSPS